MFKRFMAWRKANKMKALARFVWSNRHLNFCDAEFCYKFIKIIAKPWQGRK